MNTKCKVLVMLFLFTMVFVSDVFGQNRSPFNIESFRGLKGVFVAIEDLDPDIEKDGLKRENIRTDVELKLRLAGIKVLTLREVLKEPGVPHLIVIVNSMKREAGSYVFTSRVELTQMVHLARDEKISLITETWSTGNIGYAGKEAVGSYVRDSIKDNVDEFINDYLSVNPK